MRAESHPTWLPESGQRRVSRVFPGSHVGCWDGLRPSRWVAAPRPTASARGIDPLVWWLRRSDEAEGSRWER